MKTVNKTILDIIIFLLIILWVYSASSKLLDFGHFKVQMSAQTIPLWMAKGLVYTLPPLEIVTGILLLNKGTLTIGLYLSAIMMAIFTGYVGLVILHFFNRIPCSCGGVIAFLGWNVHFLFNLFYLLLTIWGTYIVYRERRSQGV
ncbi:MauE/DoxX family redox-associated membrane protein [Mucilaginibacter sp. UYCu711]|uniref:MauE/DoxX family redox-associated membrane protein n=1 Tax=Mucilaginibacter sp. UYCu711 TaxID=3156339 RepID=UPI003D24C333